MSHPPLKIGYVGAGFLAQSVHLPNLKALPACELVALAEIRPQLGRAVQRAFDIPKLYDTHLALAADPEVQAIAISGSFAGQGDLAADVLRLGKPVFVEKPMAVSVAQAERILEAERHGGARLMVGYMKRYDAGNRRVKQLVTQFKLSGEVGGLRYIRCHGFCGDWLAGNTAPVISSDEPMPPAPVHTPEWMPAAAYGGYVSYLQQYTHNVNLVRWLLDAGDDAHVRRVDLDADGFSGVVVFDIAGVRMCLESGRLAHHAWDEHTQLYFDRGWIRTDAPPLLQPNNAASVEVYRTDAGQGSSLTRVHEAGGRRWAYRDELSHFIDAVQTGAPFESTALDTLFDVRLFEDIFKTHLGIA
jgi:predicted dehydrogenase